MAKTYVSPITGESYNEEAYKALTIAEKRAAGFYHDPAVVYETVEDKVANFDGGKEYTLEAAATVGEGENAKKEKIPVGTKIHGMEETHFKF